jgi:Xaa-Pro aminopeptidase
MCFTVEPGLYVPANDKSAPKEFRGLGVRIEDNVHVTPKGCDVLTTHAPKDIDAIEEACQG